MASSKIKGITIEIGGNTTKLGKSDSTLYITDAHFLVSIRIGNFVFKLRANGNLPLVKVN
jgi:hypothetical protein